MGEPVIVLHVVGRLDIGGAESRIMDLYRNIDRETDVLSDRRISMRKYQSMFMLRRAALTLAFGIFLTANSTLSIR